MLGQGLVAGQDVVDQAFFAGQDFGAEVTAPLVVILGEQGEDLRAMVDHGDVDDQIRVPDALVVALAAPEPTAGPLCLLFLDRKLEPLGLETPHPGEPGSFEGHFWRQHSLEVAVTVGQMAEKVSLGVEHCLADAALPLLLSVLGLELVPVVNQGKVDQQVSVVPDLGVADVAVEALAVIVVGPTILVSLDLRFGLNGLAVFRLCRLRL